MSVSMDANRGGSLRLALVIPAFNEAEVIGATLAGLPPGLFTQVIVAVNGSTDRTATCARDAGATVVEVAERGYGVACLAALEMIDADAVCFLQADGSEDAREFARLAEPIARSEADMVLGSRTMGQADPGALLPHQRFGNWLATTLIRWIYGHRYTDLGPFRVIRADVLRRLGMREPNYGWTIEMQVRALEAGLRVIEVPVSYSLRKAGTHKVSGNARASLRAGWVILRTLARLAGDRRR